MITTIDINADVGEGIGNDKAIMPYVSSCSIACGGHAGTAETIRNTLLLAKKYKLKIGVHPSYPDTENFGRKSLSMLPEALKTSLRNQLSLFIEICSTEAIPLHHLKLHGALYNDAVSNPEIAKTVLSVCKEFPQITKIYTLANNALARMVPPDITVCPEAFIDRNYNEDGGLVARSQPNAIIENPKKAVAHLVDMVVYNQITTLSGNIIPNHASTYCIHGDHKNTLTILKTIHKEASTLGISIQ